jgi:hypothetical protein
MRQRIAPANEDDLGDSTEPLPARIHAALLPPIQLRTGLVALL